MKHILIILIGVTFIRCNPTTNDKEIIVKVISPKITAIEKYLNNQNSHKEVYLGTEIFAEIISNYLKVNNQLILHTDLFDEFPHSNYKRDSIFYEIKGDSLYISSIFYSSGRCLNFYPYIEKHNESILIRMPEIIDAKVIVENGDTLIEELGCSLENIVELKLTISKTEIPDLSQVYFSSWRNGIHLNLD